MEKLIKINVNGEEKTYLEKAYDNYVKATPLAYFWKALDQTALNFSSIDAAHKRTTDNRTLIFKGERAGLHFFKAFR